MLRLVLRNSLRTLTLSSAAKETLKCESRTLIYYKFWSVECDHRFCSTNGQKHAHPFDGDEYIYPYKSEDQTLQPRKISRADLNEALSAKFRMSADNVEKLSGDVKFKRNQLADMDQVLNILLKYGADKDSLVENPWILKINPRFLDAKLEIIRGLNNKNVNDVLPLLRISLSRLRTIALQMKKESDMIPGENRIYFISEQLKLEPRVVSRYLSRRLFMLEMPLQTLVENLQTMVNFGVSPLSILRDLWAFRYKPKSIKSRFERAKDAKKGKIMPWMVRCPERILLRSLKLSLDESNLLGEGNTVVDYVARRLGYDSETTAAIMSKHQATFHVRVTKIKEILDYLLDIEGYQPFEIAQVIRILCHSLETTKTRLEELKSYGCRPSSLVIVCKSRKEYEKFVRQWVSAQNKWQKSNT